MRNTPNSERQDVYTRVTDKIIADLEYGVIPWQKPWRDNPETQIIRPLRHNGTPYRGINTMLLWGASEERGYISPYWMSYRQATALGGQVKRGEKGSLVVFANRLTKTDTDENGNDTEIEIPYMKGYTVFNVQQIDGLPERYTVTHAPPLADEFDRIERADAFKSATNATIFHGDAGAYYVESSDHIQMPPFERFRDAPSYYAILLHELIHWTKHPARLNRDLGRKKRGDAGYAREELVAELGAAFLCADLGLTPETRPDHASYIDYWIKVLREDKRAIFSAAAHAQRAADYLIGLQPQPADPQPEQIHANGVPSSLVNPEDGINHDMKNSPDLILYAVRKFKAGDETKESWTRIGAAWQNKDGKGYSLKQELMPVGSPGTDYSLVLREPKPGEDNDPIPF